MDKIFLFQPNKHVRVLRLYKLVIVQKLSTKCIFPASTYGKFRVHFSCIAINYMDLWQFSVSRTKILFPHTKALNFRVFKKKNKNPTRFRNAVITSWGGQAITVVRPTFFRPSFMWPPRHAFYYWTSERRFPPYSHRHYRSRRTRWFIIIYVCIHVYIYRMYYILYSVVVYIYV